MAKTQIISLMFHRVNCKTCHADVSQFAQYLAYLVEHFPIVVPGETIPNASLAISLTFDDAYFDFYHDVFPLLKQHGIKALLAVPVKYIVEKTNIVARTRLSVPYPTGMENEIYHQKVPFCTWEELREMAQSKQVIFASHSYSHANLAENDTCLKTEIEVSKRILEHQLQLPIKHFVYPYGKMTRAVHQKVCQFYEYGIRIGTALNLGWDHPRRYVYRVDAQSLWTNNLPIDHGLIKKLTHKYWLNRLRLK